LTKEQKQNNLLRQARIVWKILILHNVRAMTWTKIPILIAQQKTCVFRRAAGFLSFKDKSYRRNREKCCGSKEAIVGATPTDTVINGVRKLWCWYFFSNMMTILNIFRFLSILPVMVQ